MSIFSRLKNAKKAADKHKDAKAQDATVQKAVTPYKHVVRHAATDSLFCTADSWVERDRRAIREQNKRRSEMSRNYSSLSAATSVNPSILRNSSYNSSETYAQSLRPSSHSRLETRRSHLGHSHGWENWEHPSQRATASHSAGLAKSPLTGTRASSDHLYPATCGLTFLPEISPVASSQNSTSSSSSRKYNPVVDAAGLPC